MAIYLHIPNINGDVTAKNYEKWIAANSVDFSVKRLLIIFVGIIHSCYFMSTSIYMTFNISRKNCRQKEAKGRYVLQECL